MTPTRRLALGISGRVVRWASPGCKEWAEGLEREAAVIESDWAALRWAIGSTRVLLDRRPAPLTTLDEVPAAAYKFLKTSACIVLDFGDQTSIGAMAVSVILLAASLLRPQRPLEYVGVLITLVASILGFFYWRYSCRDRVNSTVQMPLSGDPYECALFYRSALRLCRDIQSGWILNSILVVGYLGLFLLSCDSFGLSRSTLDKSMGYFILLTMVVAVQTRAMWFKRQRQIANLDALLARGADEAGL